MPFLVAGAALEVGGHLERGGLVDGLEVLLLDCAVQVASEVPPVRPKFGSIFILKYILHMMLGKGVTCIHTLMIIDIDCTCGRWGPLPWLRAHTRRGSA